MTVPSQVQARADAADKLQQSLVNGESKQPGTADPAPPANGTAPVMPPAGQPTPPESQPNQGDLQQKYKSLLGRCEAQADEIRKLKAEKDTLYKQIADANRKAVDLERALEEAKAQSPTNGKDPDPDKTGQQLLDVEYFSRYDDKFGDMARMLNKLMSGQAVTPPPPDPAQPQAAAQPKAEPGVSRQQLLSALISDVYAVHRIDFNAVNQSQDFITWLGQYDQMSGKQHLERWREAVTVRDKDLCLQVIGKFLGSPKGQALVQSLTSKPAPSTAPNQQPNISSTASEPVTPAAPQGKMWTRKEIRDFYTELAKHDGQYAADPALAKSLETDIMKAQTEGRIQA